MCYQLDPMIHFNTYQVSSDVCLLRKKKKLCLPTGMFCVAAGRLFVAQL